MFENDEVAWEISDFLELEDDEIKFFRKKKIPKKVITKMENIKAEMREEEKEEWRNSIKEGIFREIPPQDLEKVGDEPIVEEAVVEPDAHNSTIVDIFDDFDDDELDEIAIEYSGAKSKTKLRKEDSKASKKKKDDEEKLDKGQTTLFSF